MVNGLNKAKKENVVRVKVRIFEESYSEGILDINIFCLLISKDAIDDIPAKKSVLDKQLSRRKSIRPLIIMGSSQEISGVAESEEGKSDSQSVGSTT